MARQFAVFEMEKLKPDLLNELLKTGKNSFDDKYLRFLDGHNKLTSLYVSFVWEKKEQVL